MDAGVVDQILDIVRWLGALAVDPDPSVLDHDFLARQTDQTHDVEPIRLRRISEHDEVPAPRYEQSVRGDAVGDVDGLFDLRRQTGLATRGADAEPFPLRRWRGPQVERIHPLFPIFTPVVDPLDE